MTTLEQHLAAHASVNPGEEDAHLILCHCGTWFDDEGDHRAHVAATWREARTVRTVEELDALPRNSMVLDPTWRVWQRIREQWVALGRLHAPPMVPFPVVVLWTPEDGAA